MILCCGEALIDFVPLARGRGGAGASQNAYVPALGGSCYNTAVTLGRLGARVGFLGGISTDFFGDQLVAGLKASTVATHHVNRAARPTTLAFVSLGGDEPHYAFYDENAAERMWQQADAPPIDDAVTAMHFGSIALVRAPAAAEFEALMLGQKGRRLLSLDPNVRPDLVGDEQVYRARLRAMFGAADIIRASLADIAWIAPEMAPNEFAAQCLDEGTSLFVATLGADGAIAYRRDHRSATLRAISTAPVQVSVVDTVGAGDAFMGGFLAKLQELDALSPAVIEAASDELITAALEQAAQVAAMTCAKVGADPPWQGALQSA
ncbi:MAG: carbohydrate kinase family protein [Alphaproteobacteria bacterium]